MPAAECCNTFAKKKTCFFLQLRLKYYILTAEIKQAFIRFSFHICKAILFIKKSAHIRIPCCGACFFYSCKKDYRLTGTDTPQI
jgi:hypothetical protein